MALPTFWTRGSHQTRFDGPLPRLSERTPRGMRPHWGSRGGSTLNSSGAPFAGEARWNSPSLRPRTVLKLRWSKFRTVAVTSTAKVGGTVVVSTSSTLESTLMQSVSVRSAQCHRRSSPAPTRQHSASPPSARHRVVLWTRTPCGSAAKSAVSSPWATWRRVRMLEAQVTKNLLHPREGHRLCVVETQTHVHHNPEIFLL
mmetsp:Transcript_50983/g.135996  ORF Transcript_50983/g.135996 Transcript_50983/m.135996 type:complete len:200 (+) Transcript_50983:584-1183(+)